MPFSKKGTSSIHSNILSANTMYSALANSILIKRKKIFRMQFDEKKTHPLKMHIN